MKKKIDALFAIVLILFASLMFYGASTPIESKGLDSMVEDVKHTGGKNRGTCNY